MDGEDAEGQPVAGDQLNVAAHEGRPLAPDRCRFGAVGCRLVDGGLVHGDRRGGFVWADVEGPVVEVLVDVGQLVDAEDGDVGARG